MHGLWSWVSNDVRAGIVRLLASKTRPGAMVHVSYNALPAWQGGVGMQRIIYEAGMRSAGRSDMQAQAGIALARDLKAAEASISLRVPCRATSSTTTVAMSTEYLSHEYMSAHWSPAFHADVVAAMAEAKLDWVSSANPMENFPELMLTPEQCKVMDRYKDPILRELIKDMCLQRQLRHDVYVRGARRMRNEERDAALSRLTVMPIVNPSELQTKIRVPAGMAEMGDALKDVMVAAMRGPARLATCWRWAATAAIAPEVVGMLVGTHQCQIAMRTGRRAARRRQPPQSRCSARVSLDRRRKHLRRPRLVATRHGAHRAAAVQFIAARFSAAKRRQCRRLDEALRPTRPEKHDTVRDVIHTPRAEPTDPAAAADRARLGRLTTGTRIMRTNTSCCPNAAAKVMFPSNLGWLPSGRPEN